MNLDKNSDEIDLLEFFKCLWEGKITIILITLFFAIFSVIFALQLDNYYKSDATLMIRESSGGSGLSDISGMASLVGINIGESSSESSEIIELVKSRDFFEHLLSFDMVLPGITAAKGYDNTKQALIFDPDLFDADNKAWIVNEKGSMKPKFMDAWDTYNGIVMISKDNKSGFLRLEVEHLSPYFARDLLDLIISEANSIKRNRDLLSSNQALDYLQDELSKTSVNDIKISINSLITNQLEKKMIINIHEDYLLTILDSPHIPIKKSKPARSIICIVITLIGGLIACLYVLFRDNFFRFEKSRTT